MSFFRTNRDRVRFELLKLLHDDESDDDDRGALLPLDTGEDSGYPPCSKTCATRDDGDGSYESDSDSEMDQMLSHTERVLESMRSPISHDDHTGDLGLGESDDSFIDSIAHRQIDEDAIKIFVDDRPYRIDIPSNFEPDEDWEEDGDDIAPGAFGGASAAFPDDELGPNGGGTHMREPPTATAASVPEYTDFDAFYEDYIERNSPGDKQFEIFGDLVVENLTQSGEQVQTALSNFRASVVSAWVESVNREYINDPSKWVGRVDAILFDMYLKQTVLEYTHHIAKLMVLFDANQTFGLNEHMYVEIGNKALEPVDMKKYKLDDLMEYYTRGKLVSRTLVQNVCDNIRTKQNIASVNLLIDLYNRVTGSDIRLLDTHVDSTGLGDRVRDELLSQQKHRHHLKLNRPILYTDPKTGKVFVFDYRKLNDLFSDSQGHINPYTSDEFTPEFVDMCHQKNKNHLMCVFCRDGVDETTAIKTVYLHPKYGPVILKFCSTVCMSDQPWNNKALQNAVVAF